MLTPEQFIILILSALLAATALIAWRLDRRVTRLSRITQAHQEQARRLQAENNQLVDRFIHH